MQHLALEVGQVHHVQVHDADGADTRKGQVDGAGRAETTGADDQGLGLHQGALALGADVAHDNVAAVAFDLFGSQGKGLSGHSDGSSCSS